MLGTHKMGSSSVAFFSFWYVFYKKGNRTSGKLKITEFIIKHNLRKCKGDLKKFNEKNENAEKRRKTVAENNVERIAFARQGIDRRKKACYNETIKKKERRRDQNGKRMGSEEECSSFDREKNGKRSGKGCLLGFGTVDPAEKAEAGLSCAAPRLYFCRRH
jgi:hypothetical protein